MPTAAEHEDDYSYRQLLDPSHLPSVIRTSEPGSFAQNTLKVRVPGILDETLARNDFPAEIFAAATALREEITSGALRGLQAQSGEAAFALAAGDCQFWESAAKPYLGRSWLDVPWYFAEAYFYRRLLEATRYFQPGHWRGYDPFAAKKESEWQPDAAPAFAGRLLANLYPEPEARFTKLLHASLWGNRADLSYEVSTRLHARLVSSDSVADEADNLLVDDSGPVWEHMRSHPRAHVAMIADNAGTELLMDLVLIDHLLVHHLASQVVLHLKPHPFFVSDAMVRDVASGLHALIRHQGGGGGKPLRQLGHRLWNHVEEGRLLLQSHWFHASSLFFYQLPADLYEELATCDLVVIKGDANYRRLLGDAHWPFTTPFADAVSYFPAPLVALRTLKAELIVGLDPGQVERLYEADSDWLVNGQRGVVQARL